MGQNALTTIGQISLEPVFGWYAVIPLAVIMFASLWLTMTTSGISLGGRFALVMLRLGAVAVLLLGWLRPGFISTSERESAGAVAVLLDRSQSMTLPSDSSNKSRWEVQKEVWDAVESATNLSFGQTKMVPYFYDSQIVPVSADDIPLLKKSFGTDPVGRATDLGKALSAVGRLQVDPPLRGVILVGDATQTVIPAAEDATLVARQMAQLDQPILMVGIGPRGEKSQLRDVAIEGLPERYSAFVKKELNISFVVNAQGMQNVEIEIGLKLRSSSDPNKVQVLPTRTVLASSSNEKIPLVFKVVVADEGEYLLEATAKVDAREQIETNNVALSFITVREGGVRILYLEGQPRPEQTFLKRALNESLDFDVSYAWFSERFRGNWPDLAKKLNFQDYDAIIIGDLDSSAFSALTAQQLAARVRAGCGVLFMGGYHSFDAGGYGRSELAPLFPIELSRRSQPFNREIDPSFHVAGDITLIPTRPHPITNLLPEPENTRLWKSLKLQDGMNRLRISSVPGVQVLLKSTDDEPVLVTGQFGRGRVLAFAGDETWRWALSGQKKIHQQFWRQALLWLIRRDVVNEGFRLDLDRRRLLIDETPDLVIEWFGGSENKPMPEDIKIELSRDGRFLQRLSTSRTTDNLQKAKIQGLDRPGLYNAKLVAEGKDGQAYDTDLAFLVRDESLEFSRPAADWQMMANLVSANRSAGGRMVLPEEVGQAIEWLRERQDATKVTTVEKRRLGDAAWDAWLYLAVFCVLMSIEWGLRKSWQLP